MPIVFPLESLPALQVVEAMEVGVCFEFKFGSNNEFVHLDASI